MLFRDERVRECIRREGVLWLTLEMSTPFAVAECEGEVPCADMINGFYSSLTSRLRKIGSEYVLSSGCERWERIILLSSPEIAEGTVRVVRRLSRKRRGETLLESLETDVFDMATGFMKKK